MSSSAVAFLAQVSIDAPLNNAEESIRDAGKASLERLAQRMDSSMDSRAVSSLAGKGVHSSESWRYRRPMRCIRIELSGVSM